MRHRLIRRWDFWLLAASALLFVGFPELDIAFTGLFYTPADGFFLKKEPVVQAVWWVFAKIHAPVLLALLIGLILVWRRPALRRRLPPRALAFMLLLLVLGPGLLVNEILKKEMHRARPDEVVEFGGWKVFSPALAPYGQCTHNCSFVSGHAAMGFYLIGLAWVLRRRRWLVAGIVLGGVVGLGRIVQGGHFLSDVVFAFWAVYLTALICARICYRDTAIRAPLTQPAAAATP